VHAKLTQAFVRKAAHKPDLDRPAADRTIYWDEGMKGFGLMVTAAGHRSYIVQYRAAGISRRYTIKGSLSLKEAIKEAKTVQGKVAKDHDPVVERRRAEAAATNTLRAVAEEYLAREGKRLHSRGERERIFKVYLYPKLGPRQIDSIKRSEIVRLLDRIEDDSGPVMADHVLAVLRRLMSWHAGRDDEFRSPVVRGMARTRPKERARERILADDELRLVWRAAESFSGPYGALVRFILVTATRLREAAQMRRSEVTNGEWVIPASRHKSKTGFLLPLSEAAISILDGIPVIGTKGWVFTTDGETPIAGFSKFKRTFDQHVLALLREKDPDATPLPRWTNHDLRRTARSLMSRAGVSPDHAERALGHVITGVRGTYDRHAFKTEKVHAFSALAVQVERIVSPKDNVVALRTGS
jgi:integrase